MAALRVALAQVNPTVGDLAGNAAIVLDQARRAAADGAELVAFPEMVLTGYPVEDLALRRSFQQASREALQGLAEQLAAAGLAELPCVVGCLESSTDDDEPSLLGRPRGGPQNAAAVLHGGRVVARYAKHHLPNYGVFDEARYFVPGDETVVVRVGGVDVALAICEDLWQDGGPVARVRETGAGLLLVLNGSPFESLKDDQRLALCQRRARDTGCALAYVNLVGGQDELVFDGDSLVVDADGRLLARAPQFEPALLVHDLDLPVASGTPTVVISAAPTARPASENPPAPAAPAERLDDLAEMYGALVTGLRDYVRKNGVTTVLLGLSGGIDSALCAVISCDAVGAAQVHGVSMPSSYSSQHSQDDAADLAARTGLALRTVPIAPMVAAYLGATELTGVAEENLQARVRGTLLMGISNQEGHLVLATGNKSELAVGYSTMYGDAVGGFAPIKDVPKTDVWALARWRNAQAVAAGGVAPVPPASIDKPPSAELRPGQLDTDSLPDYAELDRLLDDYVERDLGADELVAAGFPRELVERVLTLTDRAEYKRRQYPPGTKISVRNFGRDRRLPITSRWRESPT
jgi:NAD+ synthase (glutamine-hydrolysing)